MIPIYYLVSVSAQELLDAKHPFVLLLFGDLNVLKVDYIDEIKFQQEIQFLLVNQFSE